MKLAVLRLGHPATRPAWHSPYFPGLLLAPAAGMKITLLAEDAIRLEPLQGPLTIEAPSADVTYSPFHMLASSLATCTMSVLLSWATHAGLPADDLTLDVRWRFADDPHRVSDIGVIFDWPSLPPSRVEAAKRVAAMCTVHATLSHPPDISIVPGGDEHLHDEHPHDGQPHDEHLHDGQPREGVEPAASVHSPAADGDPAPTTGGAP